MLQRLSAGLPAPLLALAVAFVRAPAAHAEDRCDVEALVQVVTPQGSRQYVYVTVSALGEGHRRELQQADITWKAAPGKAGGADVTITVLIPLDAGRTGRAETLTAFPTRVLVSTQAF